VLAETMAVIVYSRFSPRFIAAGYAILLMSTAGLVTWGASVALLVFYRDWLPGTVVLVLGLLCAVYHGFQVRVSEWHCYNTSHDDTLRSVMRFYCDPLLFLVDATCAKVCVK
jgi:hypothetical protein